MRKLFVLAAASLLAVPAFAAFTPPTPTQIQPAATTTTLTIEAYSFVTVQMDSGQSLVLDPTPDNATLDGFKIGSDTATGYITSGTNNYGGADVTISLNDDLIGVKYVADPGAYDLYTDNATNAAFDSGSVVDVHSNGTGHKGYADNGGTDFTVSAKLGANWFAAPAGVQTVTVNATMVCK